MFLNTFNSALLGIQQLQSASPSPSISMNALNKYICYRQSL
jgi:hypothetical protein